MNDRRRHNDPIMNELIESVAEIRKEQGLLREEQKLLREQLQKSNDDNKLIIEFFEAGKGAFKFFGYVGGLIKWVGGIAAAIAIIWAVFTHNPIGK